MTATEEAGQQILLRFNRYHQLDFNSFESDTNSPLITMLKQVVAGESRTNVYLWGQHGCGKSHLLQAACTEAAKLELPIAYIPLRDYPSLSPLMLQGLEGLSFVCVDDIDSVAGIEEWEQALFHFYNRLRELQTPLIMSAQNSPKGSAFELQDLKSRLGWDQVFHLTAMDDLSTKKALQNRAKSRGFELSDEVVDYLFKRVARDTHSLFELLDQIDTATLIAKKKITVPFLKTLID